MPSWLPPNTRAASGAGPRRAALAGVADDLLDEELSTLLDPAGADLDRERLAVAAAVLALEDQAIRRQ
jgi:hypothetical protein